MYQSECVLMLENVPRLVLPACDVCCCRCWSTDPSDRPSSSMVCQCLALMIADRQQALGLADAPGSASGSSSHNAVPPDP
jgi:hypothetical protein